MFEILLEKLFSIFQTVQEKFGYARKIHLIGRWFISSCWQLFMVIVVLRINFLEKVMRWSLFIATLHFADL